MFHSKIGSKNRQK